MKNKFVIALALAVLLAPVVLAAIASVEDFEDDTVGANPTGPDYTFLEATSVDGFVINSDSFSGTQALFANTEGGGVAMNYGTSKDWCGSDSTISHWFKAIDTGGSAVSAYFMISDGEPTGNFDDNSDVPIPAVGMQYFHNRLGSAHRIDSGSIQNGPSGQNALSITEQWYQAVVIRTGDCDGSVPYTLEIYDSTDTLLLSESAVCSPCNFGSQVSTLVWVDAFDGGGGSPDTRIDDVTFGVVAEHDPPLGLSGDVIRLGGLESSGKVQLRWLLSPDDPDQNSGSFSYHIYEDGVLLDTDTVDSDDGSGIREYIYYFTGLSSFGTREFQITADSGGVESVFSCSIFLDMDTLAASDDCGQEVVDSVFASEFDEGLESTIAEFGFVTAESQMLFSLLLIGMVTVATGAASKWLAPSKWKNWIIVGVGILIGVMSVIIGFLDLWAAIVATMLGVFAVRGAGEARNTFYEIRERLRAERAGEHPTSQEMVFQGTDLDEVPEDPVTGAKVLSGANGALVVDPEDKTPEPESVAAVKESLAALDGGGED